jgi:FkbM family methyltransferase
MIPNRPTLPTPTKRFSLAHLIEVTIWLARQVFAVLPRQSQNWILTRARRSKRVDRSLLVNQLAIKQCAEIIAGVEFVGQELQDMYAYLYFKGKRDGFFIDIGAYDGITISNTYALERIGWTGICVEPVPEIYRALVKNRNCTCVNAAIYKDDAEQAFIQTKRGRSGITENMSTESLKAAEAEGILSNVRIKPISFDHLMRNSDTDYVDFLSIDVEGSELGVLESIDFDKYKFGLIAIEANAGARPLREFMFARGYKAFLELAPDLVFIPQNIELGWFWWIDPSPREQGPRNGDPDGGPR